MTNCKILHLLSGAKEARGLTVIIDVFRAFSLECYLYDLGAALVRPVGSIEEARTLHEKIPGSLLIGERSGIKVEGFDFGNSPSQVAAEKEKISGKVIIHTTSAGTQGIVNATGASEILTGSLLEVSRSEARLVALDGFRLAMQKLFQPFELPEGVEVVRAIIPGKVLNELSRILPDDDAFCTMLFDRNRMQCTFGNIRLTSGLLAGEYIDYRRILPSDFKTEARANRISVQDAIDRASLMAREGKNNLIKMSFHDDILKITSNAELGDVEEEMDASLNGDPIDIAFNARYITDVIRNVSDDNLCMKFNSNISPCVVVPESGDDFVYLILPVRVFQ